SQPRRSAGGSGKASVTDPTGFGRRRSRTYPTASAQPSTIAPGSDSVRLLTVVDTCDAASLSVDCAVCGDTAEELAAEHVIADGSPPVEGNRESIPGPWVDCMDVQVRLAGVSCVPHATDQLSRPDAIS